MSAGFSRWRAKQCHREKSAAKRTADFWRYRQSITSPKKQKNNSREAVISVRAVLGREPAAETSRSTVPGRNPLPLTVCTGSKQCCCQVRLSGGGRSDAAGQPYRPCRNLVGLFISALLTLAEVKIPTRPDVSGSPQDNRGFRPGTVDHRFSGGSSPRTTRCEICALRYFFFFF